jgi:hypothetical protein
MRQPSDSRSWQEGTRYEWTKHGVWCVVVKHTPLAQQDDDRRAIGWRQSELEVELFWSYDRPRGWAPHRSPSS